MTACAGALWLGVLGKPFRGLAGRRWGSPGSPPWCNWRVLPGPQQPSSSRRCSRPRAPRKGRRRAGLPGCVHAGGGGAFRSWRAAVRVLTRHGVEGGGTARGRGGCGGHRPSHGPRTRGAWPPPRRNVAVWDRGWREPFDAIPGHRLGPAATHDQGLRLHAAK